MRILSVYIDRFGQFNQWTVEFPDENFSIVYGPNEAGKSTLVTFMSCILFGFPRKADLEPYLSDSEKSDVGGRITVRISKLGDVTIVRYRRGNGGKATVYLADGSQADESQLKEWLGGLNRELFAAIFSFDLNGLNGIDRLHWDDLNRFLFSAGMVGSSKIFEVEDALEKKIAGLFKPSGRVPEINQLLTEIKALNAKMKHWDEEMNQYLELKKKRERLNDELEKRVMERQALEGKQRAFLKYQSCETLMIDHLAIQKELADLPAADRFPENGLDQFQQLQTKIVDMEAEIAEIKREQDILSDQIKRLVPDEALLEHEKAIRNAVLQASGRELWRQELTKLEETIRMEQEEKDKRLRSLNSEAADRIVAEARVGLDAKETLKETLSEWETATQQRNLLEANVHDQRNKIKALKEKHHAISQSLSTDEAFKSLEEKVHNLNPDRIDAERHQLMSALKANEHAMRVTRMFASLKVILPVTVILLFLIVGFSNGMSWKIIGAGVLLALCTGIGLHIMQIKISPKDDLSVLKERLKTIDQTCGENRNYETLKAQYDEEKALRARVNLEVGRLADEEHTYRTMIQRLDQAELACEKLENAVEEWRMDHGFPVVKKLPLLLDIYTLIKDIKDQDARIKALEGQKERYKGLLRDFDARVQNIGREVGNPEWGLFELEKALEQTLEIASKRDRLTEKWTDLEREREALNIKLEHYRAERQRLLDLADVETEAAFFSLGKIKQERDAKQAEDETIMRQLNRLLPNPTDLNQCFEWLASGYWDGESDESFQARLTEITNRQKDLQESIANVSSHIEHMEANETVADLYHDYEEKRALLNEKAKKWAVYQTAAGLLNDVKKSYRDHRLPALLTQTSRFFHTVTNGAYRKVNFSESNGFTVERSDGHFFKAVELSRGTAEQLYLCIRVALMAIFDTPESLPIIIDDSLVNFDHERRRCVMALLKERSADHQILFFTCHRYQSYEHKLLLKKHEGRPGDDKLIVSHPSR
ncbi:AAA family ATPase [Camelliibacillus cellulosilyticus]|uniref:AAA family ATPase n=1 Tax=Camelliibacillus cellulosilyticus TaxID=2174486 RepID=A0ABV9GLB1_9BACL